MIKTSEEILKFWEQLKFNGNKQSMKYWLEQKQWRSEDEVKDIEKRIIERIKKELPFVIYPISNRRAERIIKEEFENGN